MGRGIQWYGDAWDEYCEWQRTDKAILKRIRDEFVDYVFLDKSFKV